MPGNPVFPDLPDLPGIPDFPDLADLPGVADLPGLLNLLDFPLSPGREMIISRKFLYGVREETVVLRRF